MKVIRSRRCPELDPVLTVVDCAYAALNAITDLILGGRCAVCGARTRHQVPHATINHPGETS